MASMCFWTTLLFRKLFLSLFYLLVLKKKIISFMIFEFKTTFMIRIKSAIKLIKYTKFINVLILQSCSIIKMILFNIFETYISISVGLKTTFLWAILIKFNHFSLFMKLNFLINACFYNYETTTNIYSCETLIFHIKLTKLFKFKLTYLGWILSVYANQ